MLALIATPGASGPVLLVFTFVLFSHHLPDAPPPDEEPPPKEPPEEEEDREIREIV